MWYVIIGIICVLVGFLVGFFFKKSVNPIGALIVDPYNPEVNGGVYTVFDEDPFKLRNGQIVKFDVMVVDLNQHSQQNQGA